MIYSPALPIVELAPLKILVAEFLSAGISDVI